MFWYQKNSKHVFNMTSQLIKKKNQINIAEKKILGRGNFDGLVRVYQTDQF